MPFPATLSPNFVLRWHSALPKAYFRVELTCFLSSASADTGPFRWCLYARVFPSHPLYAELLEEAALSDDNTIPQWCSALRALPLHGGCTYASLQVEDSRPFVKFGSDYTHYQDEYFTKLSPEILQSHSLLPPESQDFAELPHYAELLRDAKALFEALEALAGTAVTESQVPDVLCLPHIPTPTPITEAVVLGVGRQT